MPKWEVVGGADKGGILVRQGLEVSSPAVPERLSTGAVVEELELHGVRLRYKLLEGTGPKEGWVSIRLPDKELLVPKVESGGAALWGTDEPEELAGGPEQPPEEAPEGSRWNPRCGERPPAEAPYTRSIVDMSPEEILHSVPKVIFSLRSLMKLKEFKENVDKVKPGAHWGITFPHNFEMLREAGAPWLTRAFHRAGTLPRDNRVVSLKVHELSTDSTAAESMGGQGMKGWLEVAYEKPHPNLHTELFVKLPFPYTPTNERVKNSYNGMPDESEILVNRLLGPALPFKIPKYYFGDISYETSNYILISEKLNYKTTSWAEGGKDMHIEPFEIEPRIVKFKDYEMPQDGFEQYQAAMLNLGRMVAEFHKGGLGQKELVFHLFPRGPDSLLECAGWEAFMGIARAPGGIAAHFAPHFGGSPEGTVAYVQQQNEQGVSMASMFGSQMIEFVLTAPRIFPELAKDKAYLKQYYQEAMEVAYYSWEIKLYNSLVPSFISLSHGNLAADNAWYWRDTEGKLQCGLLDFGGACTMNITNAFQMSWLMAEPAMLKERWQDLLGAFAEGVQQSGGPEDLNYDMLRPSVCLALAMTSPLCGGNVQQLLKIMKKDEWAKIKGRWDPVVNDRFLNRNYTCAMRTTLLIWKYMGLYEKFKEWRDEQSWWFPQKKPFQCPLLPNCLA